MSFLLPHDQLQVIITYPRQRYTDRDRARREGRGGGDVQKVSKFIIFKLYITPGSAVVSGILQAFYIRAKIMLYNWQGEEATVCKCCEMRDGWQGESDLGLGLGTTK